MKVQLIGKNFKSKDYPQIVVSPMDAPRSLDEFDVNVIDLSSDDLWRNKQDSYICIDSQNDFNSIKTMVDRKLKSKIVYVMPQNVHFYYHAHIEQGGVKYWNNILLKDQILAIYQHVILKILPSGSKGTALIYENTRTTICSKTYEADFYFDTSAPCLTKSNSSEKTTTIKLTTNDIYATTLKISNSQESLLHFLLYLFGNKAEEAPEWFSNIVFGDDCKQHEIINISRDEIKNAERKIDEANTQLAKNSRYKSILYTNGDELVKVVFNILEQLLKCDLSDFVDEGKEDFLIETDNYIFIGEIKGITSNVRSENISQIDTHYHGYLDDHPDADADKIHQILIVNPLRKQDPSVREPVHENQIRLAKRNGCLIVETYTLLRLLEEFNTGNVSSDQCIDAFCSKTGLLNLSDVMGN
ncbi:MAG: hypothetical protein ACI3XJ_07170 [Oscillospiraceae bacterium]